MSRHLYTYMLVLAVASWQHSENSDSDTQDPNPSLDNITARAGQFQNPQVQSANEAELILGGCLLLLILALSRCKYRANLPVFYQNGAKKLQIDRATFLCHRYAETLAIQWLHETGRLFLETDKECQMISSPICRR